MKEDLGWTKDCLTDHESESPMKCFIGKCARKETILEGSFLTSSSHSHREGALGIYNTMFRSFDVFSEQNSLTIIMIKHTLQVKRFYPERSN